MQDIQGAQNPPNLWTCVMYLAYLTVPFEKFLPVINQLWQSQDPRLWALTLVESLPSSASAALFPDNSGFAHFQISDCTLTHLSVLIFAVVVVVVVVFLILFLGGKLPFLFKTGMAVAVANTVLSGNPGLLFKKRILSFSFCHICVCVCVCLCFILWQRHYPKHFYNHWLSHGWSESSTN